MAAITWYAYLIATAENRMLIMELLAETFYALAGLIVIFNRTIKNGDIVTAMNGWVALIENRKRYGIATVLSAQQVSRIRLVAFVYIAVITVTVVAISSITVTRSYDNYFSWTTVRRPVCIVVGFIQVIVIFHFSLEMIMVRTVFESANDAIKSRMDDYLAYVRLRNANFLSAQKKRCDGHFQTKLQGLTRLHSAVYFNFRFMTNGFRTSFMVWFCLMLSAMIFNCYIFIVAKAIGYFSEFILLLELRTVAMVGTSIYWLWNIEKLTKVVSAFGILKLVKGRLLNLSKLYFLWAKFWAGEGNCARGTPNENLMVWGWSSKKVIYRANREMGSKIRFCLREAE